MKTEETFYAGTIVEVLDPVLYIVKVDIPGVIEGVKAFPTRGEIDEPRVGDFVILLSLDSTYHSYYLYKKVKENDFIGFRSNGKMIDIQPDSITIATFIDDEGYNDNNGARPTAIDFIKIDKDGNITIQCSGEIKIDSESYLNIVSHTETTISAPSINIKGPGTLTCKGTVVPGDSGPFVATPVTPSPGSPFPQGDTIILE